MPSQVDPEGVDFCQLQGMADRARTLAERHLEAYARLVSLLEILACCGVPAPDWFSESDRLLRWETRLGFVEVRVELLRLDDEVTPRYTVKTEGSVYGHRSASRAACRTKKLVEALGPKGGE